MGLVVWIHILGLGQVVEQKIQINLEIKQVGFGQNSTNFEPIQKMELIYTLLKKPFTPDMPYPLKMAKENCKEKGVQGFAELFPTREKKLQF